MVPTPHSVNQSAPSEPGVMLSGALLSVGMGYSMMALELAPPVEPEAGAAPAPLGPPMLPHAASVATTATAASGRVCMGFTTETRLKSKHCAGKPQFENRRGS